MQVLLHRDDIVKILDLVDKLNPADVENDDAGFVNITVDSSSDIGLVITASVPYTTNGVKGRFSKMIVDDSSW